MHPQEPGAVGGDRRGSGDEHVAPGDDRPGVSDARLQWCVAGDPAVRHRSSIAAVRALSQIEAWPGAAAAAVVVGPEGTIAIHGDAERVHPWAS